MGFFKKKEKAIPATPPIDSDEESFQAEEFEEPVVESQQTAPVKAIPTAGSIKKRI